MVKAMPEPKKDPKTGVYYYRQRAPKDVVGAAKGQPATVTINGMVRQLHIGDALKVSLGTKDPRLARAVRPV
jgi:hypothetical protein